VEARLPHVTPDYQRLFESIPGLYLVLDVEYTILTVSDNYLRATMTQREEILARGIFEVFPDNPDDPEATGVRNLRASLDRVRHNGVPDTMPVQKYDVRKPESVGGGFEERYWSPINSPVFDHDHQLVYIIHRVEDVTDFIRLRQTATDQTKLTHELQDRAIQMETEVFCRSRELGEANAQLDKARHDLELRVQQRTLALETALRALQEMTLNLEQRVDERTAALQAANEKLQEHDRLKSSLVSVVSHELRTPITSLKGYVENMLDGFPGPLTEKQSYYLTRMWQNLERLARMLRDLLDLSRIEGGHATLNLAPVCLSELLGDAVESFQPVARERSIAMRLDVKCEQPVIQADRDKLHQVVTNLLDNATKYSPKGGKVEINIHAQDEGSIQLCVQDTGCGIQPEELSHIFNPFYRGHDAARLTQGSGLGLTITKRLVELHKGQIWIESDSTRGTRCYVKFPIQQ
jgi:signal transduction histidine kinase